MVGSKKAEYLISRRLLKLELTVASDLNIWIKESIYEFKSSGYVTGHGYPYKYPYGYAYSYSGSRKLLNESLSASDFKMVIYGEISNPTVYIGSHKYTVDTTIEKNEYLKIDSLERVIEVVHVDGTKSSVFAYRDRDSYVFERIPPGVQVVSWSRGFGFDITIYARRSEPFWT